MNHGTLVLAAGLVLATASTATAGVFTGNPIGSLHFRVELTGESLQTATVQLAGVSLEHCDGGGQYLPVGQQLDAVQEVAIDVPDDDWCAATFHWNSIALTGQNSAGAFAVDVLDDASDVQLAAVIGQTLTPHQVTEGQTSGIPLVIVTAVAAP